MGTARSSYTEFQDGPRSSWRNARDDRGTLFNGPRVWGRRGAIETIHFRRRRTVRATLGTPSAQTVRMVLPQGYEGDQWPECDLHPRGPVECIGVPYEATGVAISENRSGLSWGGAVPRATTV